MCGAGPPTPYTLLPSNVYSIVEVCLAMVQGGKVRFSIFRQIGSEGMGSGRALPGKALARSCPH